MSSITNQSLFTGFEEKRIDIQHAFMGNVIIDRGSKYSVSGGCIKGDKLLIKDRFSQYVSDKYFKKATHNSYAYRLHDNDGILIEGKNDDGEIGSGQCILTVLQRENIVDCIIIVTRYFGGVHLNADRFRNVINATKIFIDKYKK